MVIRLEEGLEAERNLCACLCVSVCVFAVSLVLASLSFIFCSESLCFQETGG